MAWDGITERRRHRRGKIQLIVESEGSRGEKPTRLQTLNLSAGGFYCEVDHPIGELTRLALRLVFPAFGATHTQEREVDCEAIVVRCEGAGDAGHYRIGACFTRLDSGDRDCIDEYVAWHNEVFADQAGRPGDESDAA